MSPSGGDSLSRLSADVVACRACPRLCEYRERVARERRRAYRDEVYWGRPVPGFGDARARLLVVGLAPAAHGANRTGRMFTGDGSGDFLTRALWRQGFASAPASRSADDDLVLRDVYLTAAVRCAPPQNRPLPAETAACAPFLRREIALLTEVRVVLVLGRFAWDAYERDRRARGLGRLAVRFGHGREALLGAGEPAVLASYHPSRQNTQTGRLTAAMLDEVLRRARSLAEA